MGGMRGERGKKERGRREMDPYCNWKGGGETDKKEEMVKKKKRGNR